MVGRHRHQACGRIVTRLPRKPLKANKPMAAMSAKKKAELAAAGIVNPVSTFRPKAPKMAAPRSLSKAPAKRQADTGPDAETRDLVLERDQHSCVICGYGVGDCRGVDYSIHHRLLRSQGVDNSLPNLVVACGSGTTGCHGAIHAKPKWARDTGGWYLKGSDNPATFPVLIERGARWVLLLPNGRTRTVAAPASDEVAA
jgi:hypothetical protein